jgi:putative DNA primase/helicase
MQDIDILTMALARFKPAMMIFDSIQSFFGNGVDMNKASDTRPVLDAVRNLCKAYGCTPFYVRHNGKSQHAKAMHSGLGSIDIAANMRSVLALYEDAEEKHRRYLAQTKTNGRKAPTMQLALTSATYDFALDDGEVITVEEVKVDWDGLSALSAADLNARQWVQQSADDEEKSALDEAREFLRAILADGPLLTTEVLKAAKEAGISEKTIKRAKAMEGIKAQRRPIDGAPSREWPWEWPLTPREPGEDDASF